MWRREAGAGEDGGVAGRARLMSRADITRTCGAASARVLPRPGMATGAPASNDDLLSEETARFLVHLESQHCNKNPTPPLTRAAARRPPPITRRGRGSVASRPRTHRARPHPPRPAPSGAP